MIKERMTFVRSLMYTSELLVVSVSFFVTYFVLCWLQSQQMIPDAFVIPVMDVLENYIKAFWLVLILWAILLKVRGQYDRLRIQGFFQTAAAYLGNGFIFFALFSSCAFLFKFQFLSRLFIISYTLATLLFLLLFRLAALVFARRARAQGYNTRNLLIVGTGRRAQEFLSLVVKHREWGYRVVGFLEKDDPQAIGRKIGEYSVVGLLEDLPKMLEAHVIDEVVFVVPRTWLPLIERCVLFCESVGVAATLSTDFFDLEIASGVPKEIDGFTFLTFETSRLKETELFLKRIFDLVFSILILVLVSPVLLITAILIKMESNGPVFFKQLRCGVNGRKFMVYKFRSMVVDAEAKLQDLQALNEMSGPVFKIKNDPRLTRIGKFIRKTSLDEFPQFWNVLKGDMSIVGPRPPLPSEVEKYEPWHRRRLSMKPGITCLWQVSGRNEIDFENWMKLDLKYIDHWTLWLDFRILFQTIRAVFTARGAR